MDHKDLTWFKNFFNTELENGKHELQSSQDAIAQNLDGDSVDRFTVEREKELKLKLTKRKFLYLNKVKQALTQIEAGTFGECQECGCDIEKPRLKARPTASFCLTCKEDKERAEGQMLYTTRSKSNSMGHRGNIISFPQGQNGEEKINYQEMSSLIHNIDEKMKLAQN